ncbi:MAG: hypothetical protein V8K32_04500 [Candidatus Electrothrix gigas]
MAQAFQLLYSLLAVILCYQQNTTEQAGVLFFHLISTGDSYYEHSYFRTKR